MKNFKRFLVAILFLPLAFCSKVDAQDFGVKGTTPLVFNIGGNFGGGLIDLIPISMPPTASGVYNRDIADTNVDGLYLGLSGMIGIKKHLGTSRFFLEPNLQLSIGVIQAGFYCYTISDEQLSILFLNNDIIPRLSLGCQITDDSALRLGAGYCCSFIYHPKCQDHNSKSNMRYDISNLSYFTDRVVLSASIGADFGGTIAQLEFMLGIGKPFKTVDCRLLQYDFQVVKPVFAWSITLIKSTQKYRKYDFLK